MPPTPVLDSVYNGPLTPSPRAPLRPVARTRTGASGPAGVSGRWFARALVRRRTGLPADAVIEVAAEGDYRELNLPGPIAGLQRWRARLDVVLLPGELRIAGNGGIWRYPVASMLCATGPVSGPGRLRVDFVGGESLRIRLDETGTVLALLRHQIAEYDTALRAGDPAVLATPAWRSLPHLGESEVVLDTAVQLLNTLCARARGGSHPVGLVDVEDDPGHRSVVAALRARRLVCVGSQQNER
jgi:hypothetical protein